MSLSIGILTISFRLQGCQSLKEKRNRLRGIRDRFGKNPSIAICESDHQDALQNAQWSYIATASDSRTVEKTLRQLEDFIAHNVDAVITDSWTEYL